MSLENLYPAGSFLNFFHGAWDRELSNVEIPGMDGASWDRKAAYLLWKQRGGTEIGLNDVPKTIPETPAASSGFEDLLD